MQETKTCPFCEDTGFDLEGLKNHLIKWCEPYDKTPTLHYHVAKYVDDTLVDECALCGRDLRDHIHYRGYQDINNDNK